MKQGHGRVDECKSKRQLNRYEVMNKLGVTNDSLLDIGKNMEMLKGDEKLFYEDQKSERIERLSSDTDFQYETEQEEIHLNEIIALEREIEEYSFAIIDNDGDDLNSTLINDNDVNQSRHRSGSTSIKKQTCEVSVHTNPVIISKPNQTYLLKNVYVQRT